MATSLVTAPDRPALGASPPPGIGDALATLVRSVGVAGQRDCRALHLTIAQGRILGTVGRPGTTSPSDMARAFGLSRQALTSAIEGLERERLVERVRSPLDRRAVQVRLTPKGRRLRQRFVDRQHAIHTRVRALLTPSEQAELARLLTRIAADLAGDVPVLHCPMCDVHRSPRSPVR